MEYDAVVLTGGSARRLGGADKAALRVEGSTLLARAVAAVAGARRIVIVGPEVPVPTTTSDVVFTREEPSGGGPAAALAAGVQALAERTGWVVVLAVDMPWVSTDTVARLLAAASENGTGAVLTSDGRRHLCAVLDRSAVPPAVAGTAWRDVVPPGAVAVAASGREAQDIDTWDDLRS